MNRSPQNCKIFGIVSALSIGLLSAAAQPTGQWDFDDANLNASAGTPLQYIDGAGGATQLGTQFGTTTSFGLPLIGSQEAKVMKFPASTTPMGYAMPTPAVANGGGTFVNDWTIIMDVLFPAESHNKLRALIETDNQVLTADSELFVGTGNGVGVNGQYDGVIKSNSWHRIGFVVEASNGNLRKYIDGIEVGVQSARDGGTPALDGRWALAVGGTAALFSDNDGEAAPGYVNSIQLRDVALTKAQMLALAGPTATGIPQTIPPIPSGIDQWIPRGPFAGRNTDVGAVIDPGSTTIQDSSISLKLDSATRPNPVITRLNGLITVVSTNSALLAPGSKHTIEISFTDSLGGQRSLSNSFTAALFFEDFEGLTLAPAKDETSEAILAFEQGWTNRPPSGWSIDNSQFKAVVITPDNPDDDGDGYADLDGRTEWAGWSFANKDFWVAADNQTRDQFTRASGTIAAADPDEWDDLTHLKGFFNSFLKTPEISLEGIGANSAFLQFDSSWRPESLDDVSDPDSLTGFPGGANGEAINNQTAIITVSFDGGAPIQILKFDSIPGSPSYHPDAQNEAVLRPLNNPAGAKKMVLSFEMRDAANDWWWAFDNLVVNAGASPPSITQEPKLAVVTAGESAALSVIASGQQPFTYQWFKGPLVSKTPVSGATNSTLSFPSTTVADDGTYSVEVTNPGGKTPSAAVRLVVAPTFAGSLTNDLVVHLKFDNNPGDSSGRGNNGTPVEQAESTNGLPGYVSGGEQLIGTHALRILDGQHIGLGQPADLSFGADTDFTFAFWVKGEANAWTGDPSFFGNKNWASGSNPGLVFSAQGGGRFKLVWKASVNPRFDTPGAGSLNDTNWHHVAGTFDRQGVATIYVDGEPSSIFDIAGAGDIDALDYNIAQDGTGGYGFANDTGAHFLKIWIDDFGIWRRALTSAEIKAVHIAGENGHDLAEAKVGAFTKPGTPTLAIGEVKALASTFSAISSAFVGAGATDMLAATVLQISAGNAFSASTGFSNVLFTVTNTSNALALTIDSTRLFPGRTYYASLQHKDQNGMFSDFSTPVEFTVGMLPAPSFIETFESTSDGGVPNGWFRSNQTDVATAGLNLDNASSDSYLDWTVVPFNILQLLGNDRPDTNVVSGKSIYAESDNRGGNQIQFLRSPEYDLTGKANVWVVFKSNYKQNQDSLGVVEYTVDGGTTWLPVVYLINDKASNSDIVRNPDGSINALTTLTNTAGDIAKIKDPTTGQRVAAGKYADFILARPLESLAPFLSGRIDDNGTESKRHERYRLAAADGQQRVQFRFVQAGTGSWWWGIDDLGLYTAETGLTLAITRQANGIIVTWTGSATLVQADEVDGSWSPVLNAVSGQVIPATESKKFYRLLQQ